MKTPLISLFFLMLAGFSGYAQAPAGKKLFTGNCQACHSIGGGDVLGPDLAGISERRDTEWIKSFIVNSQKMIAAGDEQAVAVFNQYNKIPMPSHNFSQEELGSLLSYIDEASQEALAAKETSAPPTEDGTNGEVVRAETDSGMSIWIKLIFGGLGLTIILLSTVAVYLYRLLQR
jgi:hypothetical protein